MFRHVPSRAVGSYGPGIMKFKYLSSKRLMYNLLQIIIYMCLRWEKKIQNEQSIASNLSAHIYSAFCNI